MEDQPDEHHRSGGDVLVAAHPVAEFAARLDARLAELHDPAGASVPVWAMSSEEKRTTLRHLATAQARLDALRLQVLVEAERDGQVADPGDRSVADWLARETHQTRPAARADLKLATTLDTDRPALAASMAAGTVNSAQARAITRALDLLPTSGDFAVTPEQREAAEAHLVALAADHDARDLDTLGRRIYAVISPEAADAYEGRLLEAEEARAARTVTLETWTGHQGVCHGRFRIPKLHAHMLKKALDALNLTRPHRLGSRRRRAGARHEAGAGPTR